MGETEFEKWIAMKSGKRKKQTGRENVKESSIRKKKDSQLKLAKQPTSDLKDNVKPQIAKDQLKLEENITVSQDLSIQSPIETKSGTAPISAKIAMRRLRSQRRRELSKRGGTSNS